jgi:glycosyltransferase involved in cell wall biosynthesis
MYVTVYTIAKNEEKHVERFMASAKEADAIVVLDTGSEDGTVAKLRELGATVYEETIYPWRFDVARNRSLELIPPETDVCVCFDLDEILTAGWRAALEAAWIPGRTEQAHYRYVWNYNEDGSEGTTFTREKIHAPGVFKWTHPVHEVLTRITDVGQITDNGLQITDKDGGNGGVAAPSKTVYIPGITCEHRADNSKSRADYLPLLELSVKEDPHDDRNTHYLGREYMYRAMWGKAIKTLERHLGLKSAVWKPERCASLRFIGRCYEALGNHAQAAAAFERACAEAPKLREPWYEAAFHWYKVAAAELPREARGDDGSTLAARIRRDWERCAEYGEAALSITSRQNDSYIQDGDAWGGSLYQIMTVAYEKLGRRTDALRMAALALLHGDRTDKSLWANLWLTVRD